MRIRPFEDPEPLEGAEPIQITVVDAAADEIALFQMNKYPIRAKTFGFSPDNVLPAAEDLSEIGFSYQEGGDGGAWAPQTL